MKTNLLRFLFSSGWFALTLPTVAQQPSSPGGGLPDQAIAIELPPVTVTAVRDLPPSEKWYYARSDGFEVLSGTSSREAVRLLRDFQRFRQALALISPAAVPPIADSSIVICSGGRFQDFTSDRQRDYNGTVSLFLHDREQSAIVVDFATKILNLMGRSGLSTQKPSVGIDEPNYEDIEIGHDRQLIRQYVRFLLTRTDFPPPPWVVEGVTQIIMDIEVSDRDIKLGHLDSSKGASLAPLLNPYGALFDVNASPNGAGGGRTMDASSMIVALSDPTSRSASDPSTSVGDRPFNVVLTHTALLPLDKFFAVRADAPEARNPLGDALWAKQAYAFVHMCLFRADGKYQKSYANFVRRLANEPPSEKLFQECFQMSYEDMLKELYAYIRYPRHQFRDIKLTKEGRLVAAEVELREATPGEIGRIKGDAQRMAGRHADALLTYRVAYARGERDPALLAALGVEEFHAGQSDRARKFLEVAAKLGTDRPSAWATLARLRLDEAETHPAATGKLSAGQMAVVLTPLLKARSLQPAIPQTYQIMAEAWEHSAVAPTPTNIHVLGEGAMRFPFDAEYTYRTARLYAQAGDAPNAAEVARMGLRFAADAATRSRFEAFLATLGPTAILPSTGSKIP